MKLKNTLSLLFILLTFLACSNSKSGNDKYQELGTAVLITNRQVIAEYPGGIPENMNKDLYLSFLEEEFDNMFEKLEPYEIEITESDNRFIVEIFDEDLLVLTDYACTESRIDCWCYNNECDPDTLNIICPEN